MKEDLRQCNEKAINKGGRVTSQRHETIETFTDARQLSVITKTKVIWQKSLSQVHPTSRIFFARWQHMTDGLAALHVLPGGSTPKFPASLGGQGPHLTQCVIGPHKCTCQMASKSVERFKQGARM